MIEHVVWSVLLISFVCLGTPFLLYVGAKSVTLGYLMAHKRFHELEQGE